MRAHKALSVSILFSTSVALTACGAKAPPQDAQKDPGASDATDAGHPGGSRDAGSNGSEPGDDDTPPEEANDGGDVARDGGRPDPASSDAGAAPADPVGADPTTPPDAPATMDAGASPTTPPEEPPPTDTPPPATTSRWLRTEGNRIVTSDGQVWRGRGANLHDTRSCNACTSRAPDRDEVLRRVDELVDVWGANFIRLDLESYASSSVLNDPSYLADVQAIVDHIGEKPGVYVMVSLWHDPSFTDLGWPGPGTSTVWEQLATTFANDPHVLYGLVNEPQHNYDGSRDAEVWTAMNNTVAAIRAVEDQMGVPHHVVAVQGTGGWARFLQYYVDHPITAGDGENVAYEVHVYDPASTFQDRFIAPSRALPVIIGEFGPANGMSMNDCAELMELAEQNDVPYLAWTFHMRCPPNLLVDHSNGGCGIDMPLEPSDWGRLFKDRLAQPWGS